MKFKATVLIPGEPGMQVEACDLDLDSECVRLEQWLMNGGSLGYTNTLTTLHLFNCMSEDQAICGNSPTNWGSRALHFATAGKKYKICLKCRKMAEGGE